MNAITTLFYMLIMRGFIVGVALTALFFIFILMLQEITRNEHTRNCK
jgi:hypothetical protein